jgi:hypothetical protein
MQVTVITDAYGSVTAHKAGCRDVARETAPHKHADHYTEEYASQRQVFLDYNADFIAEADGDEYNCYEIRFLPCTEGLPKEEVGR